MDGNRLMEHLPERVFDRMAAHRGSKIGYQPRLGLIERQIRLGVPFDREVMGDRT